jgi:tape measure domain-containing protein
MLGRLYKLAAVTPFEFPDLVKGTRTMLAYGMASEDTYQTMKLLGDAIASAPTEDTANQIARTTRALGQIQAAGILHAQDLNQLVDAGVTSVPKLAKSMGMSTKEFRKQMMLGKIDADRFFKAQRALWESDPIYSGMAAKQAQTFYGRLATLHDYTVQALGSVTETAFQSLTKKGLPAAIRFSRGISRIWKRTDLPFEEKLKRSKDLGNRIFTPLLDQFEAWWRREEVTRRLQDAFAYAVSTALKGAGKGMWIYLKTLFQTMWSGNWAAKIGAGILLVKLGLHSKLLRMAGKSLWRKLVGGGGLGKTDAVMNVKAAVVNVYGGGGTHDPTKGKPGLARRALDKALRYGPGAAYVGARAAPVLGAAALEYEIARANRHHNFPVRGRAHARRAEQAIPMRSRSQNALSRHADPTPPSGPYGTGLLGGMASGGVAGRSGFYDVGEHGRERVYLPKGSNVKPGSERPIHIHTDLVVDRRVLASTVHRAAVRDRSTR